MGNTNTKESRPGDSAARSHRSSHIPGFDSIASPSTDQPDRPASRRNRVSRGDLQGILGLGSSTGTSSHADPSHDRRETKQEREARRLEKERVARLKDRERSMKEEHVDGGYLVTLGTYTGPEDFNKQVVRQLQIERKLAPFWRGLNDFDDKWTEHQIIAAVRGLPVPPADQTPPEELIARPLSSSDSPAASTQNLNNLTVPIGERTLSAASEHSGSNVGSALPSPIFPARTSSPFRPRGKALAAVLGGSSRNGSTTEIVPREINLPNDPFVNGQPLEVYLYKDSTECPICFLSYPPYLNHTRCCDQAICSECFVQIKRPDPHYPEGHNENDPNHNPEETAGMLVSEPACCPYCTQPDFGVTYEPPPFRRGLTYTISPSTLGAMNTAMSSTSSLNSGTLSPTIGSPIAHANRRRTQSLSANAPNVILTDRIRPDWSTKLQAARAHQARRAAAATALHTAAFLMGSAETRPFRVSRFSRRNTGGGGPASAGPNGDGGDTGDSGAGTPSHPGPEPGPRSSSGRVLLAGPSTGNRRSRMEDLEEMMFMEAIRLSLAAEEERKRKAEKEERKEAKKREKEERKAAKAAAKHGLGPYNGGGGPSGQSSASGSTLSLPGLAFGRKRGNSGASNLRVDASVPGAIANATSVASAIASSSTSGPTSPTSETNPNVNVKDKGKGVDRSLHSTPETRADIAGQEEAAPPPPSGIPIPATAPRPIPPPHQPAGPSHLRQMSSASSIASSAPDSRPGSFTFPSHVSDPRASGLSLGSRSGASEDGGDQDRDRDPSASTEPMFNFRSLAEVVGVSLEGEHAGRRLSRIEAEKIAKQMAQATGVQEGPEADEVNGVPKVERIEDVTEAREDAIFSFSTSQEASGADDQTIRLSPPKVTITPETPAPGEGGGGSKRVGYETAVERPHQATQ